MSTLDLSHTSSRQRVGASRNAALSAWLPIALLLLGVGWGANEFVPLLPVYTDALHLSTGTATALFGFYALGLIPGLLVAAPLSDARGRRMVVIPAALISLLASVVLVAGSETVPLLYCGRLLAGLGSGVAFGAGTAWLREASAADGERASARRAAVAMTAGFGLGPLVAGLIAQWAPDPRVVAYLPHIVLMAVVLVALLAVPETVAPGGRRARFGGVHLGRGGARFRRVVVPMAPWVFTMPAIVFALLPTIVGAADATDGLALIAVTTSATAFAGVLIQPLARRLDAEGGRNRAAIVGLLVAAAALALGAVTAASGALWLLPVCAIPFGASYGLLITAGLVEVGRLAPAGGLGTLTAVFYTFAYLGFAVPYVLAVAHNFAGYPALLAIAAGLALATAALVSRPDPQAEPR
jgi:MFS family permease